MISLSCPDYTITSGTGANAAPARSDQERSAAARREREGAKPPTPGTETRLAERNISVCFLQGAVQRAGVNARGQKTPPRLYRSPRRRLTPARPRARAARPAPAAGAPQLR